MAARDVPEAAAVTHAGIAIWGTLEARVQSADLVILGGLNEGIWPRLPGADPWLGRSIRRAIGLPSPERLIGLSAHDFQQAMGARRGRRHPRHPRRRGADRRRRAGCCGSRTCSSASARRARRPSKPPAPAAPASPPTPPASTPPAAPVAARPAPGAAPARRRPAGGASVTQIERLVRDPYGDLRPATFSASGRSSRPAASPMR